MPTASLDYMQFSARQIQRFARLVEPTEFCWDWLGKTNQTGYGIWTVVVDGERHTYSAHLVAYVLRYGALPEDMQIDHVCNNTGCVNPEHLEAVTQHENIMRSRSPVVEQLTRTHCPYGHPLTPDNIRPYKQQKGHRECAQCHRDRERQRYHDRKDSMQ